MNEKAVSVLEQYDRNVIKSFKGRGTMICETDKGYCVLKEYTGTIQKLAVIDALQHGLSEMTSDYLIPTREGELFCEDQEHVKYILKELVIGQEMNYKDEKELYKVYCFRAYYSHSYNRRFNAVGTLGKEPRKVWLFGRGK